MKYAVLTTKHHEGFCLWDSALTDYKAPNTPAGRDLLRPLVDAFRAEGLRIGFYHSLIDWHHPDFPIDGLHPQRDDQAAIDAAQGRDMRRYTEYLHGQVRELLTGYGQIDYLFFDFSYPDPGLGREGPRRLALGGTAGADPRAAARHHRQRPHSTCRATVATPEQYQPAASLASGEPAVGGLPDAERQLGLRPRQPGLEDAPTMLVRMLVDGVSKDGNLLLNVGPTGRGEFEPVRRRGAGRHRPLDATHGRSVYGAGPAEFTAPPDRRYTQRGDRLYLHLFAWPFEHVHLRRARRPGEVSPSSCTTARRSTPRSPIRASRRRTPPWAAWVPTCSP